MAITHLQFNDQTQHGRILRQFLNALEEALDRGNDLLAVLPTMIDGDGSQSTQFPDVTAKFGFVDDVASKSANDELNSVMAKLNTDASVSSVNAAIKQAIAKFR